MHSLADSRSIRNGNTLEGGERDFTSQWGLDTEPTSTVNSVNWTAPASKLNEYQRRAIATRRRRLAADKRLAAQFAQRRVEFLAKLDAIVAAAKGGK